MRTTTIDVRLDRLCDFLSTPIPKLRSRQLARRHALDRLVTRIADWGHGMLHEESRLTDRRRPLRYERVLEIAAKHSPTEVMACAAVGWPHIPEDVLSQLIVDSKSRSE